MSSHEDVIRIPELNKLDAGELTEELSKEVQFEQATLTTDKTGEPVTVVAVIALSALAIKGISMWLMKPSAGVWQRVNTLPSASRA